MKRINNPEYSNIREEFTRHLGFDIVQGLNSGRFLQTDIRRLNEIVMNRHRNVHASHDPSDWYSRNIKDILYHFPEEYPGLINIISYLDSIKYDPATNTFKD